MSSHFAQDYDTSTSHRICQVQLEVMVVKVPTPCEMLPTPRRQKEQPAAAGDGQLPSQITLCIFFTPALSNIIHWRDKLEGTARKISISITTVLFTIALILSRLQKHFKGHFCPSISIILLI